MNDDIKMLFDGAKGIAAGFVDELSDGKIDDLHKAVLDFVIGWIENETEYPADEIYQQIIQWMISDEEGKE